LKHSPLKRGSIKRGNGFKTRKPMSKRPGRRSQDNAAARSSAWPVIYQRCGGACELCGIADNGRNNLVWAHIFGRPGSGANLGVWASSAELTTLLCSANPSSGENGCHDAVDLDLNHDMRAAVRGWAWARLEARARNYGYEKVPMLTDEDECDYYLTEVRGMVRALEASGILP